MSSNRLVRARSIAPLLAAVLATKASSLAVAQEPSAQPPPIPSYRAPAIALVQPPNGISVPQDKPVLVFRFTAGDPSDPLDVASFRVAVDGLDQTQRFQIAAGEAWGALVSSIPDEPISTGSHQVAARICSSRGACGETQATVSVVPPLTPTDSTGRQRTSRRERLIDALLSAVKRLLQQP